MCKFCEADNNDFMIMNDTTDYSGIEMAINRQGMLRIRYYMYNDAHIFESEDIAQIRYCPVCGRKFND
jgi:hypothetical protein